MNSTRTIPNNALPSIELPRPLHTEHTSPSIFSTPPKRSHIFTNSYKKNLKILSWNIRSRNTLEANKLNIPEFRSILERHDIICLQETKAVINLENYKCFNSNRKLLNSDIINSKSGGVAILVRKELAKGITKIPSKLTPDALIIKVRKDYFHQTKDIYIISAYISPSTSLYRKAQIANPWELLQELVSSTISKGELILCGDFNAWTNTLPDFVTDH